MPTQNHYMGRSSAAAGAGRPAGILGSLWPEVFNRSGSSRRKVKRRDLAFVLRNLATMVNNGLALPKALGTLARERSMRKYAGMLNAIRRTIESGETFTAALSAYPKAFNEVMVNQIQAGERAGRIGDALIRLAQQVETGNRVRAQVARRLAYPAFLVVAGSAAVTFMLLFVIPVFKDMYSEAKVPLPSVTRALMAAGQFLAMYGWLAVVAGAGAVMAVVEARKRPGPAAWMDGAVLGLPVLGDWFRNLAVLQFMDVFGSLTESGFKVVRALDISAGAVKNRVVRQSVEQLRGAVTRGEQFGTELEKLGSLFPPVVAQLINVGEQTGSLPKATSHIREHLRQEIERQTSILVGIIEPVLTISLAATIAFILLAIYLPMFDMIGAMGQM